MWIIIWTFIKKFWPYVLVGLAIIALCSYIGWLKFEVNHKAAQLETQKQVNAQLARANEILENNKAARAEQDKKLEEINDATTKIQGIVSGIPKSLREALKKDEKIALLQYCIAQYNNKRLLPDRCDPYKERLQASQATTNK